MVVCKYLCEGDVVSFIDANQNATLAFSSAFAIGSVTVVA